MASCSRPARVQSAAFFRTICPQPSLDPESHFLVSKLPVSESRFSDRPARDIEKQTKTRCSSSLDKPLNNPSLISQLWRQVHSTHSESRLRSLNARGCGEEPVRRNLLEKIDRLRRKHEEQQQLYQKCLRLVAKKTLQHSRTKKTKGGLQELGMRVREVLDPFEKAQTKAEQRYRSRLVKARKF